MSTEQVISHDEATKRGRWIAAYIDANGKECRVRVERADGPEETIGSGAVKRLKITNFRYLSAE